MPLLCGCWNPRLDAAEAEPACPPAPTWSSITSRRSPPPAHWRRASVLVPASWRSVAWGWTRPTAPAATATLPGCGCRPPTNRAVRSSSTTTPAPSSTPPARGANANPLGVSGLPALGEAEAAPFLAGPLPDVSGADRDRFAGRRVLVVGAGHSATNTLLHLVALADTDPADGTGTRILWAVRGASVERTFGGGDLDGLPARGGPRLTTASGRGVWAHSSCTRRSPSAPWNQCRRGRGHCRDDDAGRAAASGRRCDRR